MIPENVIFYRFCAVLLYIASYIILYNCRHNESNGHQAWHRELA
jgi:hypothetical protein